MGRLVKRGMSGLDMIGFGNGKCFWLSLFFQHTFNHDLMDFFTMKSVKSSPLPSNKHVFFTPTSCSWARPNGKNHFLFFGF